MFQIYGYFYFFIFLAFDKNWTPAECQKFEDEELKKLKVPVYVFLKEALTRKFGKKFYEALAATAEHLNKK